MRHLGVESHCLLRGESIPFIWISDLMTLFKSINESGLVAWASSRDYHVDDGVVVADEVDVILGRRLLLLLLRQGALPCAGQMRSMKMSISTSCKVIVLAARVCSPALICGNILLICSIIDSVIP